MKTLLSETLTGDIEKVRAVINHDDFVKSNEEILLALRVAIQNKFTDIVLLFDKKFNLDISNDPKTISLAAASNIVIWNVFFNKPNFKTHKFIPPTHPLVVSFKLGVYDIAETVKAWADKEKVPAEIKMLAVQKAADNGHTNCIKLYNISEKTMLDALNRLISNGHSSKVEELTKNGSIDFSFNNFDALKICSAHFDALSALIVHPSIKSHVDKLPPYYKLVEAHFTDDGKRDYFSSTADKFNRRVQELIQGGLDKDRAYRQAMREASIQMEADKKTNPALQNKWLKCDDKPNADQNDDEQKKKEYMKKLSDFVNEKMEELIKEGQHMDDAHSNALMIAAQKMKEDEKQFPFLSRKWIMK